MNRYIFATIPALLVLGLFTFFANWIPQSRWTPPVKLEISADMTPQELARIGESLVKENGCLVCHTIEVGVGEQGRGRGPNFFGIGGRSRTTVEYLVTSLYEPASFVAEGYSPIMPAAILPPAKLTYEEVTAVVDYLLSLGGTASVKVGDLPRPPGTTPTPTPTTPPPAEEVQAIFTEQGCLVCHQIAGQGGTFGPALDRPEIKEEATASGLSVSDYLRESILNPGAHIAEGYPDAMPKDLGDKLTANEFQMVVEYLASIQEE